MENDEDTRHRRESTSEKRPTLMLVLDERVTRIPLSRGVPITIGRTDASDVVLPDPDLSRKHARFVWNDEGVWVEDLDSTNGTLVGGQSVKRVLLTPSDRVGLGNVLAWIAGQKPGRRIAVESPETIETWLVDVVVKHAVALVFVRSIDDTTTDSHVGWIESLRGTLSPGDRIAAYGRGRALVVLLAPDNRRIDGWLRSVPDREAFTFGVSRLREPILERDAFRAVQSLLDDASREVRAPVRVRTIAESAAIRATLQEAETIAASRLSVLLIGESGTGKEHVADAIHTASTRASMPYQVVNCGAIPEELLESTWFGHERGAFTGADATRVGAFEASHRGTLLLDEVAELSRHAQAALLRVLQSGEIRRVGGVETLHVDVRVLAATHRDLAAMVADGSFRRDLWFRLAGAVIEVPPLRARVEDILPLAQLFLARCRMAGESTCTGFAPATINTLLAYDWPGNVRELRNTIERAALLAAGREIEFDDLPTRLLDGHEHVAPRATLKERLRAMERELIIRALERHDGKQAGAAKELGIPARTLSHRIRALDIDL